MCLYVCVMRRHIHFIAFWLSSFHIVLFLFIIIKVLLYFAILKDPVVKYLVAEVAYLQLCEWNYAFYTHWHHCQLRLLFCSQNSNNHLSKWDHMGLSELYFPHVRVIWDTHSLAHAGFLHRFSPHAVYQMHLLLDEKATFGQSHVNKPHIPT